MVSAEAEDRAFAPEDRAFAAEDRSSAAEDRGFALEDRAFVTEDRSSAPEHRAFALEDRACVTEDRSFAPAQGTSVRVDGGFRAPRRSPARPPLPPPPRSMPRGPSDQVVAGRQGLEDVQSGLLRARFLWCFREEGRRVVTRSRGQSLPLSSLAQQARAGSSPLVGGGPVSRASAWWRGPCRGGVRAHRQASASVGPRGGAH